MHLQSMDKDTKHSKAGQKHCTKYGQQYEIIFWLCCNAELREAGLFTEDGVMYNRVTFDTITKSDQFKLTLVWEITF